MIKSIKSPVKDCEKEVSSLQQIECSIEKKNF
jgi:hypothetical protein